MNVKRILCLCSPTLQHIPNGPGFILLDARSRAHLEPHSHLIDPVVLQIARRAIDTLCDASGMPIDSVHILIVPGEESATIEPPKRGAEFRVLRAAPAPELPDPGIEELFNREIEPPDPGDWSTRDFNEPCYALIACDNGDGCVLDSHGTGIEFQMVELGMRTLADLGLDDAPDGLSVWRGRYRSSGPDYSGETDEWLEGTFTPATLGDIRKAFPSLIANDEQAQALKVATERLEERMARIDRLKCMLDEVIKDRDDARAEIKTMVAKRREVSDRSDT